MNELQKALMRRRSLNGELGGKPAETGSAVGDGASVPAASPPVVVRKETVKVADPKPSASAANELQAKLARRRGLNGEVGGNVESTVPTAPATTESEVTPSAAESPAIAARADSLEQQQEESAKSITPRWLTEAADRSVEVPDAWVETQLRETAPNSHDRPPETIETEKAGHVPPGANDDNGAVLNSDENDHLNPTQHTVELADQSDLPVLAPANAIAEAEPASSAGEAETGCVEALVVAESVSEVQPPALPPPALEPAQAAVPTLGQPPISETLHVPPPEPVREPEPQQKNLPVPLPLSTLEEQPESQPEPQVPKLPDDAHHHMHASTELPTIPSLDETAPVLPPPVVSAIDPEVVHAPARLSVTLPDAPPLAGASPVAEAVAPTTLAPPSKPDAPAASPKPAARIPAAASRDPSPVPSTSPLWRSRTSTGSSDANSPKTSRSPLRRTTSLTGSQSVPSKRSPWYPGKYLLEGLNSKNASPRGQSLSMDPQAARDHYAALLTASALEYPEEKILATAAEHRAAMDAEGGDSIRPLSGGVRQRDQELKEAQLPDMVAAGASDDTIDMVLQLSRENASLKREVAHLKAELARAQAVIKALSPQNSDKTALTQGGDGSTLDSKNDGSDKSSVPSSAAPSLSKAKSFSRRFGARSYYSNYDSSALDGVGDDETDEGLFGEIDALSADRQQRNGTNSSSQYNFAIEELAADVDSVLESGAVTPKRRSSKGDFGHSGSGPSMKGGDASDAQESSEQNLDMLLKSVTSSGHKERRAATDSERYLVQSFMSTSTITPKEPAIRRERNHSGERTSGDLPNRLAGLIFSDAKDQLFGEEAEEGQAKALAASGNPTVADTMEYDEFVGKLKRSADLAIMIRDFILSVLGPNGDGTAPVGRRKPQLHYIFYGTHKLDIRCRQFFDSVQDQLPTWPEFQNLSDERMICARDGIEQYVMTRIGEYAFKSVLDTEGDELLLRRMKLLSFVKPEMLGINPGVYNEMLLSIATDALRMINKSRTPAEKAACVVKTVTLILRSLSLSKTVAQADRAAADGSGKGDEEATYAGADDLVPLFIWVVLRSHIPLLSSNVNYVMTYLNPARMMGQSGYCITQLSSAVQFVKYAEPDQFLLIEPKDFEGKLMLAEKQLNGGF